MTALEHDPRPPAMASETELREDLAAAFRWAAHLDMNEGVANHFSVAVDDGGERFLINPRGMHFSQARASELAMMDTRRLGEDPLAHGVDPTAWVLHGHLHERVPRARCVLHTHMPYATALACLRDFEFLMLDQNACRFYDRIAYDRDYAGMALDPDEGARVAAMLDVAQISDIVEVAHMDTEPRLPNKHMNHNINIFVGPWGVYPFFDSGTILVTSMQEGLFMLKKRVTPIS